MGASMCRRVTTTDVKEDTREEVAELKHDGFVHKRKCTDVLCLLLYLAHLALFVVVTVWGVQDGNPAKLIRPRDFQGAYCDTAEQWNRGPNLQGYPKLSYTMNVSSAVEGIVKQFVCSSAARDFLVSPAGFDSASDAEDYLCACCWSRCQQCLGSSLHGGDIAGSFDPSTFGVIEDKITDLTDPAKAGDLFNPAGSSGDFFSSIWQKASVYFHRVCLPRCEVNTSSLDGNTARAYTYSPSPLDALAKAWAILAKEFDNTTLLSSFEFKALPKSVCPYSAEHCIPFPGVDFREGSPGYCTFNMSQQVIDVLGSTAATLFEAAGGDSFVEKAEESIGLWIGDFQKSVDTFCIVCVAAFIIGLIYLVVLRFTVRFCVWFAVFVVFLAFITGGFFIYVRSGQCKNDGFFDSVTLTSKAAFHLGSSSALSLVTGEDVASEELIGDGADYRGTQTRSRGGLLCQAWDSTTPHDHSATVSSTLFPQSGLNKSDGTANNYCRNPYLPGDKYRAPTIWCFTTDPDVRWEVCYPQGTLQPKCVHGYAVGGERLRETLKWLAYFILSLGLLWLILVCCLRRRILLAVALNEVAAKFLSNTPTVLVVPVIQTLLGCMWVLGWMLCASFLLSQVPDSYTPTQAYESYSIAYGTQDTPGECTDKWPTGWVWRAAADECDLADPEHPKCWRCTPPRFILDWRFFASAFSLLWNNALLIAFGQCVIAGAVGAWFFTPNSRKGHLRSGESVLRSNWNVWRYHLGSLAFGSFVIALVQFIRYFLKYLEKQAQVQKNYIVVTILRVLQCFIFCFERFIKFLNKNAYIQIAIRGTPFCTSAKKAFSIIVNNVLRFGTVAILGSVIYVIGIGFIMAATLIPGYFLLGWMHPDMSPAVTMVAISFMGYVVGRLYMNVFTLAVDTCLQCVIFSEEECPDGSFVPPALRSLLDQSKARVDRRRMEAEAIEKAKASIASGALITKGRM